ncbi:hypothetical protein Scep_019753 [Stephania cephalantha]|uniref:Small auxin up regulated protein n=1 Tax=Stephania cephalantha TaxID=152367 RepID=A0AAP0IB92_9MAGN
MKSNTSLSGLLKKMCCCGSKSFQSDLPKGHIRVYVGKSSNVLCMFEIEAYYLNHPLFEALLKLSGEELGYSYDGALRIACEIDLFKYLLDLLEKRNSLAHYMELQDLISKFYSSC